jgi:hypothetical protein
VDPDTARSTLGIPRGTTLTASYVEAAFAHAVQVTARPATPGVASMGAGHDRSVLRPLEEARAVLLRRSRRLPPWGEAIGLLTVMQFFLGGFVLFGSAIGLMIAWATWYDGAMSLIGWVVGAVSIAVISMVIALLVGLPLRLVHRLRSRWLANGELTVAGVLLGFVAIEIVLAAAPISTVVDELGPYEARDVNGWALLIAWSLFAFSIAHFVWPLRWTRRRR